VDALSDADAESEVVDTGPADVDAGPEDVDAEVGAEAEVGPPPVSQFTLYLTSGDETRTLVDATYEGFTAYEFGAEVYGHLLRVWGSDDDASVGVFYRTDDVPLPGSAKPGVPGGVAWLTIGGDVGIYATQMPGGAIVIENCPAGVGDMIRGRIEGVVAFDLLTMSPSILDGTFEVVLGAVAGNAVCSDL